MLKKKAIAMIRRRRLLPLAGRLIGKAAEPGCPTGDLIKVIQTVPGG